MYFRVKLLRKGIHRPLKIRLHQIGAELSHCAPMIRKIGWTNFCEIAQTRPGGTRKADTLKPLRAIARSNHRRF